MTSGIDQRITMRVCYEGKVIFQSNKRWLFPLFDFEEYLQNHPTNMSRVEIRDTTIGKAVALLNVRLGTCRIHGDVMSKLAAKVFNQAGIRYTYGALVDKIDCQTEEILKDISDPETAYRILCKRANRC